MIKTVRCICEPFDEGYRDTFNGVWLGLLAVAWIFLVGTAIERLQTYDLTAAIHGLTLVGGSVGIFFAIFKFVHDIRWKRSETYMEQATDLLEKAYDTLGTNAEGFPINDRQRWLSSSRLLLAAGELGARITEPSHKDTYEELVDYWRVQFGERVEPNGRGPEDEHYYYEHDALSGHTRRQRAPIDEMSIAVIYRFMGWPKGQRNRLENIRKFTDDELSRIHFTSIGLYQYCLAHRNRI